MSRQTIADPAATNEKAPPGAFCRTRATPVVAGGEGGTVGSMDAQLPTADDRRCPDGGRCHHDCNLDRCFRVGACGPLSGVYPDDRWPVRVTRALGGSPARAHDAR